MSQKDADREVVCTLNENAKAERSEAVQTLLTTHYVGYEEYENRLDIRFDGTDEALRAVAAFTANELHCCSFAKYEISVAPPYEETILAVSGPNGTRQLFYEGMIERLEEASA